MGKEAPDLSGLLGGMLSNPAALSSLMGVLGTLGGGDGKGDGEERGAHEVPPPPPLPPPTGGHRDRDCLIAALSPYLSEPRRQALLGACKLLEVIELLKKRT